MKKIIAISIIIFISTNVLADKMTKSGFLTDKVSYLKEQKIEVQEKVKIKKFRYLNPYV